MVNYNYNHSNINQTCALLLISQCIIVVESYELTGRHIYLPMAITAGCVVAMLLSLVALYRNLAPRPSQGEKQTVTSATSKIDILEQDTPHGTY